MKEVEIALVLSAGGMFGAYQAGAWKALEPVFRPAIVVGTSAGALNGWAIAGGASGDDLTRIWLDPRNAGLMRPRALRPPWKGVFDPAPLEQRARELMDAYPPGIPFAGTVVEVRRLRPRLIRASEMTPRHLVAMCAIPFGFPPVRLDGRWCVDGGLKNALPLWAAAELGYANAVAVNVLPVMPSRTVRMAVAAARRFGPLPTEAPQRVWMVAPSPPLGSLRDSITWQPERIREWIRRGQQDTETFLRSAEAAALTGGFV